MTIPANYPPPVNPDDPGRGPMIVRVTWVFTILPLMAVSSWVYVRRKQHASLGWEVWLMITAMVIRLAQQIQTTVALRYGLGKHDASLTPEQLVMICKFNWSTLPGGTLCSLLARFSITILLIRLFGVHRKFKAFLIALVTLQSILSCVWVPITFLQITPTYALWDIFTPPTSRWDPRIWLYVGYTLFTVWTFSDLIYVLLPVTFIWNLQMPMPRRLGLIFLMCLSLFTMTMSILKTIWLATASKATKYDVDVQYHSSLQVLFSILEMNFVILMGCMPSLRVALATEVTKIPSLRSSLPSLFKRRGASKQVSSSNGSGTAAAKYEKSGGAAKVGLGSANGESRVIISTQPRRESQDTLTDDYTIRRTDEWNVVYENKEGSSQEIV